MKKAQSLAVIFSALLVFVWWVYPRSTHDIVNELNQLGSAVVFGFIIGWVAFYHKKKGQKLEM
jgi:hypothetical protein